MENRDVLTIAPVDHPDARIRRIGFDLSDPYVERCWGPVLGPTATMLLRRFPVMWEERTPSTVTHGELSRSLGLGERSGRSSRLMHSLDRIVRHNLARWQDDGVIEVFCQAPGLELHQLRRLPEWTVRTHERLLDRHIAEIGGREETAGRVATITARLDRLERPRSIEPAKPTATARAVER